MWQRFPAILAFSAVIMACADNQRSPTDASNPQTAGSSLTNQTQEPLFSLVLAPALTKDQSDLLSRIRGRPSSAEVYVGRLTGSPQLLLQPGKAVIFRLSPTEQLVALGKDLVQRAANDLSWRGEIENALGTIQLVLTNKGVTATVKTSTTLYGIEPIGGGLHALIRIGQFPPDHPPDAPSGVSSESLKSGSSYPPATRSWSSPRLQLNGSGAKSSQLASMSPLTRFDVLVAYTPSAAAATGDINGLIQLSFDVTNTSYSNSAINLVISPAHVGQVDYSESGRSYAQHVAALQSPSDGMMDIVHTWRNQYNADVVVLLVNDTAYCGIASTILAGENTAFAAVAYNCAVSRYSFAHEIGHLQGARHDTSNDPNSTNGMTWVHGYVDPNYQWRTIMAYGNTCGDCTRVQYWSNPNIVYPPTGQVMGTATWEHDARMLDESKPFVGLFRPDFPVSNTGPSQMGRANSCYYNASASGGAGPYTYTWSWHIIGSGSAGGYSPSNGTFVLVAQSYGDYTIYLKVIATDSNGRLGTATKAVAVSSMTSMCSGY